MNEGRKWGFEEGQKGGGSKCTLYETRSSFKQKNKERETAEGGLRHWLESKRDPLKFILTLPRIQDRKRVAGAGLKTTLIDLKKKMGGKYRIGASISEKNGGIWARVYEQKTEEEFTGYFTISILQTMRGEQGKRVKLANETSSFVGQMEVAGGKLTRF